MKKLSNFKQKSLILIILALLSFSHILTAKKTKNNNFLHNCNDSLSVLPRVLLGVEDGKIRWGLQFSILKIIFPKNKKIYPFLETGITLFDKLDASPDDKKHLFMKIGLLLKQNNFSYSINTGLLYGNEKIGPSIGLGIWKFFNHNKKQIIKKPSDFKNPAEYLNWKKKQQKKKKKLINSSAISIRTIINFRIEPTFISGIFYDIFF